ncbi:uncharacterized protein PHALS_06702 [Plasmopara halstedii]|uniref:RxLR-like protein n=1 Tax=Plasmopara halstedii TaxID=4781 RepID=A0A0P1B452_PLAHL|nr:uncharacterized protein PHALS_06702 [Plasmopara halstedii]CEG48908.1 hypothetical protein PHALS_06702 [Plasmopara halstedii]|eukprot:XP_024585277.1 hypothetical protein PHALS_06702 [Plasmopara halstedii]
MNAFRFRFATLLLLVVTIACSNSIARISADAPVENNSRLLRNQVEFSDAAALSESEQLNSSSSSSHEKFVPGEPSHASETEHSAASASHEKKHEGPTLMSFVGPAVAGVLAILLIGAVIAFKNRMNK